VVDHWQLTLKSRSQPVRSWTCLLYIITVHTFHFFRIPNPSLLSASCTSGLLEFSRILVILPTSVCCRILSSFLHFRTDGFSTALLLFLLGGWGSRNLEQFCFAFSMQWSPVYWFPRGTEVVRYPLPRKLLREATLRC
jgi:hypothetical protein